ncbi:TetR/AcrR family transcriptional regulator [Mycobacterium sp. NPDC003449]
MKGSTVRRDGMKRPLRADAQRSKNLIVAAAAPIFMRDGAYASLEEIAQSAGVGSATLHRHFPSRWDLLESVFAERVRSLSNEVSRVAENAAPRDALIAWLHSVCAHLADTRGLADALLEANGPVGRERTESCLQILADAGAPLLERAHGSGVVCTDITITELLLLAGAIAVAAEHGPVGIDRLFRLTIEGIAPPPVPG